MEDTEATWKEIHACLTLEEVEGALLKVLVKINGGSEEARFTSPKPLAKGGLGLVSGVVSSEDWRCPYGNRQ